MKKGVLLIFILGLMVFGCSRLQKTHEAENSKPDKNISEDGYGDPLVLQSGENEDGVDIQLIKKHDLSPDDLYLDYDGGRMLSDYFLIELVDEGTFMDSRTSAVNMLSPDTAVIRKRNGKLRLPCDKKEIILTDNLSDGWKHQEYTYIGQIKSLNVYLVSGIYWEDWNYFFVDKSGGNTLQTFSNMPYLSANGKYIICLDFDTFEGAAFIDLYKVTGQKHIDSLVGLYVKKWVPIITPESIFWGKDNYLYVPVMHSFDYAVAEDDYTGLAQYIRLKPVL
jgi:hypothetical protein